MAEHNGLDGKLMTLGEAVERFVHDGDQICVGGFTITRNPMAAAYEIARRRVKDLHLVAHSNGQASAAPLAGLPRLGLVAEAPDELAAASRAARAGVRGEHIAALG